jgi:hypothetical protein
MTAICSKLPKVSCLKICAFILKYDILVKILRFNTLPLDLEMESSKENQVGLSTLYT